MLVFWNKCWGFIFFKTWRWIGKVTLTQLLRTVLNYWVFQSQLFCFSVSNWAADGWLEVLFHKKEIVSFKSLDFSLSIVRLITFWNLLHLECMKCWNDIKKVTRNWWRYSYDCDFCESSSKIVLVSIDSISNSIV